jgi:hypothetical protein
MAVKIKWYGPTAKKEVDILTGKILGVVADAVLAQAQDNIEQNDQVDTGFMLDSGYVIAPYANTHGNRRPDGTYTSSKTGYNVARSAEPQPPSRDRKAAVVGFSADYTIYPELSRSFLWRALGEIDAEAEIARMVRGL